MIPKALDLNQLKSEIDEYIVIKCRLHHEKIAFDPVSGKPVFKEIGGEKYFERVGFCPGRKKRLGCAHSSANTEFANMLTSLQVYDPAYTLLWEKFDQTLNRIYALDHQKSDLEKRLVQRPSKEIKQKIKNLESEHSELIDEIASVLCKTLEKINWLLIDSQGL